ncbi:MAG: hypothetical protein HY401_02195 [Elusimicrobia bacterium]|nr:hypothetical protein [Elusimicrobiota bacterium]
MKSVVNDPILPVRVRCLYPFDLGMELDLKEIRYSKEVTRQHPGEILFKGKSLGESELLGYIYPFGIGMLELSFNLNDNLERASELAIASDRIHVGRYALTVFFQSQVNLALARARLYARSANAQRVESDGEVFNLFTVAWQDDLGADAYLKKYRKTLFGMVTGDPSYARLSDYALQREALKNIGYYDEEIILINRFGAFIHSQEEETLRELVSLSLAQYFNVRAAGVLLEKSLLTVQRVLENQPHYYRFWKMPAAYQLVSREQRTFAKAKAALVESLNAVHVQSSHIESDWHLKSVHKEILTAFDTGDLSKITMRRMETIDSIYAHLGEHLSTMFFIFLDFVFLAWLFVDLAGWVSLIVVTALK